jgi:DNA-binding transcriptional MocR family regulator
LLALLPQLPKVRFTVPVGGFSIWLEVDCGGVPDEQFLRCALKEGVAVDPGVLFRAEPEAHPGLAMRLSFSATPLEQLPLAIERLGRALEQLRSANRPLVA